MHIISYFKYKVNSNKQLFFKNVLICWLLTSWFTTFISSFHSLYKSLALVFSKLLERILKIGAYTFEHIIAVPNLASRYGVNDTLFCGTQTFATPTCNTKRKEGFFCLTHHLQLTKSLVQFIHSRKSGESWQHANKIESSVFTTHILFE